MERPPANATSSQQDASLTLLSSAGVAATAAAVASLTGGSPFSMLFGGSPDGKSCGSSGSVFCAPRHDLSPAITKPLGGLTPKLYKQWSVQPKGVGSVFARQNVMLNVARSLAVHLSPPMDTWFRECMEAENNAEENNLPQPVHPPFPDLAPHKTHVYNSLIETFASQVLRRWMEEEAFVWVDTRVAWKLFKDVRESAIRKVERGLSTTQLVPRITMTCFRSSVLGYLSEAIVRQIILLFRCWQANKFLAEAKAGELEEQPPQVTKEASLPWLARQSTYMLVHVSLRAVLSSVVLALLASQQPKYGSLFGQSIGDTIVGLVVQSYMMTWAEQ